MSESSPRSTQPNTTRAQGKSGGYKPPQFSLTRRVLGESATQIAGFGKNLRHVMQDSAAKAPIPKMLILPTSFFATALFKSEVLRGIPPTELRHIITRSALPPNDEQDPKTRGSLSTHFDPLLTVDRWGGMGIVGLSFDIHDQPRCQLPAALLLRQERKQVVATLNNLATDSLVTDNQEPDFPMIVVYARPGISDADFGRLHGMAHPIFNGSLAAGLQLELTAPICRFTKDNS